MSNIHWHLDKCNMGTFVSFIIFKLINLIQPLRVSEEEEELGLDATQHDEKYGRNPHKI